MSIATALVERHMVAKCCIKCGAAMLYHDYDPNRSHNGATCLMCGTEQPLDNGLKSLIDPTHRRRRWQ